MAVLGNNARLLSNDVLAQWLLEDYPYRIQLARELLWLPVSGDNLRYATTGPLDPAAAIGHADQIPDDTKQPKDPNRAHTIAELATQFRISYKALDVFSSNVNSQMALETALGIRELLYKFWTLFEVGDSSANPAEFDGVLTLVDPKNVIDLQGAPLTLEILDCAKELVTANDGRCPVLFTNSYGKRAVNAAHWTRNLSPQYEEREFRCPDGSARIEQVLKFDGAPVFINDLNRTYSIEKGKIGKPIPPAKAIGYKDKAAFNIYFFIIGPGHLHGIVPEKDSDGTNWPMGLGEAMWGATEEQTRFFRMRQTNLPDSSVHVVDLTFACGLARGSASCLSAILNATIPA